MTAILNQIAENWFGWQLAMFWQVGVLIVIVAGLDLLIKKWAWPQVRYALWFLILVKLVLPPTLTSPMSFTAEIPITVKQALTNTDYNAARHGIENVQIRNTKYEIRNKFELPKTEIQNNPQYAEIIPVSADSAGATLSWKSYILFVWAGGVAILTGWLVIRLTNLRREHLKDQSDLPERLKELLAATARKLGLKKVPQIILTNKVCCPAVFGVFRPVLLMPSDKLQNMTMQDAENIFLHELAHIKRGDLWAHAVYMILQIAYWFNPLIWLIRKHLQNLRELCCDATVARILREKTTGYRQTLLDTARQLLAQPVDPGLGLLGLFENSSWLVDRLRWLEKKSWKYRPLRIATIFTMICVMSACVLPMTKYDAPADFVIKGTVTDAETGKPIAGAKVGDVERYAEGKQCTTTNEDGEYSYKTWYEEHNVKAAAEGYKEQKKTILTKVFGSEKEKVMNFALLAAAGPAPASEPKPSEAENKPMQVDGITRLAQIRNMMVTLTGIFNATRSAISDNSPESAAKIMEETLPQFEKLESAVKETNYSDSVHMIVEQIRQIIKANKDGDSARVKTLLLVSSNAWYELEGTVDSDYKDALGAKWLQGIQKGKSESQKPAGQDAKQQDVDLYVADFSIKPYETGGLYTVTAKIGNRGTATAPEFRLNFYRGDPKDNLNLHGKPQSGSNGAGPIKPGEFWNESSMPFSLEQGVNELSVVLDTDNSIAETNKLNNSAEMNILFKNGEIIKQSAWQDANAASEQSGKDVEARAEGYDAKYWEQFGQRMAEWGEQFGEQMQKQYGQTNEAQDTGKGKHKEKNKMKEKGEFKNTQEMSAPFAEGSTLVAKIVEGAINITGGDVSECKVKAKFRAKETDEQTQAATEKAKINLVSKGSKLVIKPDLADGFEDKIEVNLEITVPRKANLQCQANDGEVSISDISGSLDAQVSNGAVKANDSEFLDKCGANVGNGEISFKQIRGDAHYELNVGNGKVKFAYAKNADAAGHVEIDVGNGKIDFGSPANMDAKIEANVQTGKIQTSLPFMVKNENQGASLDGTLGSGKGHIELSVKAGKVTINSAGSRATDENWQKPAEQNKADNEANKVSQNSAVRKDTNSARTLKINVYEGNSAEPQTSIRIPLVAMKIVRQLLPPKDKLQIIAQKIKLDENLPKDMNSQDLIEMLDDMLKKLDQGVESTTLLEVKDGGERIIISLE
jgi:beta-lactamase regulating signal transducer with metallopeptidase domain